MNKDLLDEIDRLKDLNLDLNNIKTSLNSKLDNTEAELNKEKKYENIDLK